MKHTSESVRMTTNSPAGPTLWRTCRIIANLARLEMLRLLFREPGLSVSGVSDRLRLPLSLTSEYLRALEARSLLVARRKGRRVEYSPPSANDRNAMTGLVSALRKALQQEDHPIESVFRLATAFTHPRRVEVYRALQPAPHELGQLQSATGISGGALVRHLRKLKARGFVKEQHGWYEATRPASDMGRELARLATA